MRTVYARAGYSMPEGLADLPDHVALELDFLSLLARNEAAAWKAGDAAAALALQEAADDFVARHPRRWLPLLARRVDEGARLALYPALLRIARIILEVWGRPFARRAPALVERLRGHRPSP